MTRIFFSILFFALLCIPSQSDAAQSGKWTLYQSFNNITEIVPTSSVCYALASGGLFSYDVSSGDMVVYDKTNYLSDSNISHIAWSRSARRLVVVYSNSNIDLLSSDGNVVNVPDLYMKTITKDKTINHIYIDGTYAYLSLGFGLLKLDVRQGVVVDTYQLDFNVDYSYVKDGYVYVASRSNGGIYRGKTTDNLLDHNNWQRYGDYVGITEDRLNVADPSGSAWWTKSTDGKLVCYTVDGQGNRVYKTQGVLPEGPSSNHFYRLYSHNGVLYGVAGMWSQESDAGFPGEVHVWDGNQWSEFEQPSKETIGHDYLDLLSMDFDPLKEGHVMVGAKGGVYEFQDGKFVRGYGSANSPIEGSGNYAIVSSVRFDPSGNLWVLNRGSEVPIKQITKDGEWKQFPHSEFGSKDKGNLTSSFISQTNGYLWFVNDYWNATKIYAYDYTNDKLYKIGGPDYVNEDGTVVTPHYMFSVSEDRDGNEWLATSSGPLYLAPSDFQSGVVTQHKVPRNDGTNLADYLLSNVETRRIAFDGAGRKWMATSNGVFLISADNNTQVEHFTTGNSPLMSDLVLDVLVDNRSNKVYFATDNGLCSYESDATQPSENMTKDDVYAYPNPVRPDYTGDVTVVGLSYNADVKIVTSNGTLVNQGRSTGGSYRWNCRDLKGKRVASGVYMVEAATEDGGKGTVCKIAVIN